MVQLRPRVRPMPSRRQPVHSFDVDHDHSRCMSDLPRVIKGRVSVIVPCFNVGAFITDCLDSVRAQGDMVFRTYCVDNGSTDDTVARIEEWVHRNPDVPLELMHEAVKGAGAARNKPLDRVRTEWIQFLDADDLLLPGKLEEQVRVGAEADVVYGPTTHRSIQGFDSVRMPDDDVEIGLMRGDLGITSAVLWRTENVLAVGGWDPGLTSSQEYDLFLRLYEGGARFRKSSMNRTVIRERASGQISQGTAGKRWRNLVDVQVRMFKAFKRVDHGEAKWHALEQGLFGGLRMLYPHDPRHAMQVYRSYLAPVHFRPDVDPMNTNLYVWAYRMLGFRGAEALKSLQRACSGNGSAKGQTP